MKSKLLSKSSVLISLYLLLCWIIPSDFYAYSAEETKQLQNMIITVVLLSTVVLYYTLNHKLKILVFILSVTVLIIAKIDISSVLVLSVSFAVMYLYEVMFIDKHTEENSLFIIIPILSVIGVAVNFKKFISFKTLLPKLSIILFFLFLLFFALYIYASKSKNIEKKLKTTYKIIMVISLIGLVSTATLVNSEIYIEVIFLPWLLYVFKMIYIEDRIFTDMFLSFEKKLNNFLS